MCSENVSLKGYFIPIYFLFKHTFKLVLNVLPKLYLKPVIYTSYHFLHFCCCDIRKKINLLKAESTDTCENKNKKFQHLPSITCLSSRNGNKKLINRKNIRSEETILSFPRSTPVLWYFSISQQQLKEASHSAISFTAICSLHLIMNKYRNMNETLVLHDELISF